jgi:hypothetical protein
MMTIIRLALSEGQLQFFKEQGCLRLERISPPDEAEFLKGA